MTLKTKIIIWTLTIMFLIAFVSFNIMLSNQYAKNQQRLYTVEHNGKVYHNAVYLGYDSIKLKDETLVKFGNDSYTMKPE